MMSCSDCLQTCKHTTVLNSNKCNIISHKRHCGKYPIITSASVLCPSISLPLSQSQ